MQDGKKYTVALQKQDEANCFKDVAEYDKRDDAIKRADELAAKAGRPAIVFERGTWGGIIYRTDRKDKPDKEAKKEGKKKK